MSESNEVKISSKYIHIGINWLLGFLCLSSTWQTINRFEYWSHSKSFTKSSQGIVTGFATGSNWVNYYVSWGDEQGREHSITSNGFVGKTPEVGDTIEVIYSATNSNDAAINDYYELEGLFRYTLFVSIGLFVLCLTSYIVYFMKEKNQIT
jgi:hypothetical protein